jgi:transketolase
VPWLVGGSADLDPSTKTAIKGAASIARGQFGGRVFHFGIREHGMGSVMNGLALSEWFTPLGSTFLIFSDYMRPPMRLAALMERQVVYVFTHDSIFLGEDGPTHQPIEQLWALRAIPNFELWRPADGPETAIAWAAVLRRTEGPVGAGADAAEAAGAAVCGPVAIARGGYELVPGGPADARRDRLGGRRLPSRLQRARRARGLDAVRRALPRAGPGMARRRCSLLPRTS